MIWVQLRRRQRGNRSGDQDTLNQASSNREAVCWVS